MSRSVCQNANKTKHNIEKKDQLEKKKKKKKNPRV
jgi:hypothetical protein